MTGVRMMRARSVQWTLLVIVAVATLWQAVGTVVMSLNITPQTSLMATFAAFLAAAIISIGLLAHDGKLKVLSRKLLNRRAIVWLLAMNAVTAAVFVSFYTAITLISPTAASVLDAGMGPAVVVVAMLLSRSSRRGRVSMFVMPAVILGLSLTIAFVDLDWRRGAVPVLFGLGLAVLTGICGAGVVLLSRKLASLGFTAGETNATRFHGAWIVSGVGTLLTLPDGFAAAPMSLIGLAGLAIVCVSLPLMLLQYGISQAPALSSELIMSTLPALVFITEAATDGRASVVVAVLMAALLVTSTASILYEKAAHGSPAIERQKHLDSSIARD